MNDDPVRLRLTAEAVAGARRGFSYRRYAGRRAPRAGPPANSRCSSEFRAHRCHAKPFGVPPPFV